MRGFGSKSEIKIIKKRFEGIKKELKFGQNPVNILKNLIEFS
jgi:hypothetical protein